MAANDNVVLKDITATIDNIRYKYLIRWMRSSQRAAVLEWRDREIPPGVKVRFNRLGKAFYGFSNRRERYRRKKGHSPDYVKTGTFREQVMHRKPQAIVSGGQVVTKFSIGGGAMNLLTNVRGIKREVYLRETKSVNVRAYTQARSVHGKHPAVHKVAVRGYAQKRTSTKATSTPADKTYRQEFELVPADLEFMKFKAEQNFIETYRGAAFTSKGELRKSVRLKFRNGGDEEVA